jgi:alkanesulfonate monooxygenase
MTEQIKLLLAVRVGEMWIPQLARQIATLDHMCGGRLNINIISSDMPGQKLDSAPATSAPARRWRRCGRC